MIPQTPDLYIEKKAEKVSHHLSAEVIESMSDFDKIGEEWNSLINESRAHIFQTYEWQRTWWECFGGKNHLHILLFRDREQLVGIMPLFLDVFRIFGSPVYRCLRLIGSRVMQPEGGSLPVALAFGAYLSGIIHPDYENEVYKAFKNYLKNNKNLFDVIIFDEIPAGSSISNMFRESEEKTLHQNFGEASLCPKIKLPSSWKEFLDDFNSKGRYEIRRFLRRITEDKIFEVHTARTREDVESSFRNLVELHQNRWNNLGQPGIFADKRILDFYRELVFQMHNSGRLILKTATANGKCAAADLMFTYKDTVYSVQRSFDDSPAIRKYAPGNALLYYCMREAIENGYNTYDFLRGTSNYKLKTATNIAHNKEVTIKNNETRSGIGLILGNTLLRYADLRCKLRNERNVLAVFFKNRSLTTAAYRYAKNAYIRLGKKFI